MTVKRLSKGILEGGITLLQVSLTAGTGSLGREFWKLYSIGFLPENTFTSNLRSRTDKRRGEDLITFQRDIVYLEYREKRNITGDQKKHRTVIENKQ